MGRGVCGEVGNRGKKMWLALASVTLAAAIGFNVLALVIQELKR